MKKLSRQPTNYLFFELARLRTLWVNNEDIRDRIEKRYKEVKEEFLGRGLMFTLDEHKIDKILKDKEDEQDKEIVCEVVAVEKAKHKVGPLQGQEIDNVYEYTLSENDKVLGRTIGTQIEVNIGDKLIVKRIENGLYGAVSKVENMVKETLDGHEGKWITINGKHIFVREEESIADTFNRMREEGKLPNYKVTAYRTETREKLEGYLSKLPKEHTDDLLVDSMNTIEFNTMRGMFGGENAYGEVGAFYIRGENNIIIRENFASGEEGQIFLNHEVGHNVYYSKMSNDDVGKWNDIWLNHKEGMPTGYAKTSPSEGFAECYAYYQKDPVQLGSPKDEDVRPILEFMYSKVKKK